MQQQQIKEIREAFIAFFSDAFNKHSDGDVQCLFDAADAQAGTGSALIGFGRKQTPPQWRLQKSFRRHVLRLRGLTGKSFITSGRILPYTWTTEGGRL